MADDATEPDSHGSDIEARPDHRSLPTADHLPFESLDAPLPLASAPPATARWLGFGAILLAGVLGAIIGWGTGDALGGGSTIVAAGALGGAVFCAVGVGLVVSLTLRAMNEWKAVEHPEANRDRLIAGDGARANAPEDAS